MKFSEVLNDIQRMKGIELQSIIPGSSVTIDEVSILEKRVIIIDSKGKTRSRPFNELEKIWEALLREPAIHVDSVLLGCGSSRNQPETIFANLPYIEWLRLNGKKHITLVSNRVHDYGTLRRMDPLEAESLKTKFDDFSQKENPGSLTRTSSLIISNDVKRVTDQFEEIIGTRCLSIGVGSYQIIDGEKNILILSKTLVPTEIKPGIYPVINAKFSNIVPTTFNVDNLTISIINLSGLYLAFVKSVKYWRSDCG